MSVLSLSLPSFVPFSSSLSLVIFLLFILQLLRFAFLEKNPDAKAKHVSLSSAIMENVPSVSKTSGAWSHLNTEPKNLPFTVCLLPIFNSQSTPLTPHSSKTHPCFATNPTSTLNGLRPPPAPASMSSVRLPHLLTFVHLKLRPLSISKL